MGVATLPCFLVAEQPTLTRVWTPTITARTAFLVVHPDIARTQRVRTVIDYIDTIIDRDRAMLEG